MSTHAVHLITAGTCGLGGDAQYTLLLHGQLQQGGDVLAEGCRWAAAVPLHHLFELRRQVLPVGQQPLTQGEDGAARRALALPRAAVGQRARAQHLHRRHRLTWGGQRAGLP